MSTVYSKLQEARKKLQNLKLNKSGKNKFSNYLEKEKGSLI